MGRAERKAADGCNAGMTQSCKFTVIADRNPLLGKPFPFMKNLHVCESANGRRHL